MRPFEAEEFWDDLLAFIEERRVIPVIGSELLTIETGGVITPLYRALADRLLSLYKLDPPRLESYGLYDAVSLIAAERRVRVAGLYRQVHDLLKKLLLESAPNLHPLRDLASIRHFDLFVTTTPDDLVARALEQVRGVRPDEIEYAPRLPTERRRHPGISIVPLQCGFLPVRKG
jgi:hypothetical protein